MEKKSEKKGEHEEKTRLIGKKIAEERKKKGLTQDQFAKLCGIGMQSLVRIEKGTNFTASTLLSIQKALRIKGSELTESFWFHFKELD